MGFRWYYNTLRVGLVAYPQIVDQAIGEIVEQVAGEIEDYMKAEAPWEDQTGAAREGLGTDVRQEGYKYYIDLFHTVDYGIWLEVRWNGQYAIIQPTIDRYGPILMGALGGTYEVAE